MITEKQHAQIQRIAKDYKVDALRLANLAETTHPNRFAAMLDLFNPRVTNQFKLSLRTQLIHWLREDKPTFSAPFSKLQLASL